MTKQEISRDPHPDTTLPDSVDVLDHLDELVITVDRELRILFVNRTFSQYHGIEQVEIVGKPASEILDGEAFDLYIRNRLEECLQGKTVHYEMWMEFPMMGKRDVAISLHPVMDSRITHRVNCILRDVSDMRQTEQELRRSERELRALFSAMTDIIVVMDDTGLCLKIAPTEPALFFHPTNTMLGKKAHEVFSKVDADRILEGIQQALNREQTIRMEHSTKGESGEIWYDIRVSPLSEKTVFWIARDITDHKQAEDRLTESREELRNLARYMETVTERQRSRIAREIHDEIGQMMTAMQLGLCGLKDATSATGGDVQQRIDSILDIVKEGQESIHRISMELRPRVLDDLGVFDAMDWFAGHYRKHTGLDVSLDLDEEIEVDAELSTMFFRVFQESLTNIAKHSEATTVQVRFLERDDRLILRVFDNGIGITRDQAENPQSFGLFGMRERVAVYNGRLHVEGTPGKGTVVEVSIPKP